MKGVPQHWHNATISGVAVDAELSIVPDGMEIRVPRSTSAIPWVETSLSMDDVHDLGMRILFNVRYHRKGKASPKRHKQPICSKDKNGSDVYIFILNRIKDGVIEINITKGASPEVCRIIYPPGNIKLVVEALIEHYRKQDALTTTS